MKAGQEWTAEHLNVLRENYGKLTARQIAELLPSRSFGSIFQRARKDGLRSKLLFPVAVRRVKPWTAERDAILVEWYGAWPMVKLVEKVGKCQAAIQERVRYLGIRTRRTSNHGKINIEEALAMYAEGKRVIDIANKFGVTKSSVIYRARQAGLQRRHRKPVRIIGPKNKVMSREEFGRYMSAKYQGVHLTEWKGFITKDKDRERAKLQNSKEWKQWRKDVFRRDRATCVMCKRDKKSHGEMVDPHHIVKKSESPELIFDVDNGVTLCRSCHMSIGGKEKKFAPQFHDYVREIKEYWVRRRAA